MTKRRKPPKIKMTSDTSAFPYMVVKRGMRPDQYKYFETQAKARAEIIGDLEDLRDRFIRLNAQDAIDSTSSAIAHVQKLTAPVTHRIDLLIDPYTNTHYRAEIVRRAAA